jgi:glycosyltransferase involved in cell wall biosynthesis
MSTKAMRGLTTIIVPCWNEVEFTQQCLAALRRHTREPWELIVVDNGSTDGTATYLAGVRDMAAVPVTVISNTTNLGFPAAVNQGLRLARGEYLVLLNNDVVVTDAWLDQLVALVNASSGAADADAGTSGNAEADGGGRPSVDACTRSGDPRTAPLAPGVGDGSSSVAAGPTSSAGIVPGSVGLTPPLAPPSQGGEMFV